MRKIVKLAFCLVLIYLFIAPSFISSIVFGKELKTCADVVQWERENFPTLIYTPEPVNITYGNEGGMINATYLVYVSRPKDNIDVRLKIKGPIEFDPQIVPFFGKNPQWDESTHEWIIDNNMTFAIVSWNPQGTQIEITASDERVFVNTIPENQTQEFVESLLIENLFLAYLGNKDLNPNPEFLGVVLGMGIVASSMIPKTNNIWVSENGLDAIYLTDFTNTVQEYLGSGRDTQILERIFTNNLHHFDNIEQGYDFFNNKWESDYSVYQEAIGFNFDTKGKGVVDLIVDFNALAISGDQGISFFPGDIPDMLYYFKEVKGYKLLGDTHVHPLKDATGRILYQPKLSTDDLRSVNDHLDFWDTNYPTFTVIVRKDTLYGSELEYYYYKVDKIFLNKLIKENPENTDAWYTAVRDVTPRVGSPSEDELLGLQINPLVNNFWYYSDLAFLIDKIQTDLSFDFTDIKGRMEINRDIDFINEFKLKIPFSIPSDKRLVVLQQLTDAEIILHDLVDNEFDVNYWMQANAKMGEMHIWFDAEGIEGYVKAKYFLNTLTSKGYTPPVWAQKWLENNLEKLVGVDQKLDKIESFLNGDFFTKFFRNLLPRNEENEGIFYSIEKALEDPLVRTVVETSVYLIFNKLSGKILEYGIRTNNNIAIFIGISIQAYFTFRFYFYAAHFIYHAVVQSIVLFFSQGLIAAGVVFLAAKIISFISGLIIGFIISIIFEIIWCVIFSCSGPTPCEVNRPWYNDYNTTIENHLVSKGGTLHYIFCGTRYCYPSDYSGYTADLFYTDKPDSAQRTVLDTVGERYILNSDCKTLDGRCFDCSVKITKPEAGIWYVDAMWYRFDENSAFNQRYYGDNIPSFRKPETLEVCSTGLEPDESENKCVVCNTDGIHIESSGTCEEVCGADSDCDERTPGTGCCSGCYYVDVNDDKKVNIIDISIVAKAFGSNGPIESERIPASPNWNYEVDLNHDNAVNIIDISMVAKAFGKTC